MSDRYDYIAINARGVYALCEDLPDDPGGVTAAFLAKVKARGHRIERVPVAEACDRHREYLANLFRPLPTAKEAQSCPTP